MKYYTVIVWTFLIISPALLNGEPSKDEETDDSILVEDEEDFDQVEPNQNIFVPTKEWKTVEEGQHIPPGLHVRMNLQTGLKEAKLLDEDTSEPSSHDSAAAEEPAENHNARTYGSDRRGAINKRTQVFSTDEISKMLQETSNSDSSHNSENLPRIASSPDSGNVGVAKDQGSTTTKHVKSKDNIHIPVSFHQDVEMMLEQSRILADNSSSVSELVDALSELEFHVHQIHNARDLNEIGGLVLVVRLLNHTHPDVKGGAAHVIGSASQSNPSVQQLAIQYGSLPLLCQLLSLSETELVQRRALFALGALLRGNIKEQINFIKTHHGLGVLGRSFTERSSQVQLKAAVLLTDFLNEELTEDNSSNREHHLELPVLVYNEVLKSGWCENVPVLIHSDQLTTIEKGLLAMKALTGTCGFTAESARLKELVQQFGGQNELDSEYSAHLLEYCRNLLQYIRTQNLDL